MGKNLDSNNYTIRVGRQAHRTNVAKPLVYSPLITAV